MKYYFEKALFINRKDDINADVDRVYFGNEFCEKLIPEINVLRDMYYFVKQQYKEFTFVTPFVTNKGINKLAALFDFLNKQGGAEVVFNDWGVFYLLKNSFCSLIPVMGRLLTKQRRDPRMMRILSGKQRAVVCRSKKQKIIMLPKKIPDVLPELYKSSVINVPFFQRFLLSQGIKRVEIDNLVWDMDTNIPIELCVSVYFPYGYISTGRMCWKVSLGYGHCKRQCKKYYFQIKHKSLPVPLYAIGNTIFYKSHKLDFERLSGLGKIRIIYQKRLPF